MWYVVIYGGESFAAADSMTLKQLVDYKNVLIIKSKIEKFMMQKDTSENES